MTTTYPALPVASSATSQTAVMNSPYSSYNAPMKESLLTVFFSIIFGLLIVAGMIVSLAYGIHEILEAYERRRVKQGIVGLACFILSIFLLSFLVWVNQ